MAIIRGKAPESNFYILDKAISEDSRLSWDERGLLIYLLGKPESWRVSVGHLIKQTENSGKKVGKARVYAMLSSLEDVGYVKRQDARDENGKYIGVDYLVSERPCAEHSLPTEAIDTHKVAPYGPHMGEDKCRLLQENTQEITQETKNNMGISDEIPDAEDNPRPNDLFGNEQPVDLKTCPWEAILDKWAEVMPDKQQPAKNLWLRAKRSTHLAQRWKECFKIKHEETGKPLYTTREEGIEWWGRFFAYMRRSDFLMGKTGNARWFKLDWIVKKDNFVKIMENHYHQ